MLDVFGGHGGLAKAVRRRGHAAVIIDLSKGEEFDLLQGDVLALLIGWINSGQVMAIFCATPCEGYSRARRAPLWSRLPHALRTPQQVHGLPNSSDADQKSLDRSNALGRAAALLLRSAIHRSIPAGEENPRDSFLWQQSHHVKLVSSSDGDYVIDLCAFKRPFRGRTRILLWNCRAPRLEQCKCKMRGNMCSFSGKPHVVLSGLAPDRSWMTKLKQVYPTPLCNTLADALLSQGVRIQARDLWQVLKPQV